MNTLNTSFIEEQAQLHRQAAVKLGSINVLCEVINEAKLQPGSKLREHYSKSILKYVKDYEFICSKIEQVNPETQVNIICQGSENVMIAEQFFIN